MEMEAVEAPSSESSLLNTGVGGKPGPRHRKDRSSALALILRLVGSTNGRVDGIKLVG